MAKEADAKLNQVVGFDFIFNHKLCIVYKSFFNRTNKEVYMLIKNNQIESFKVDDATTINRYNYATDCYDIVEIIIDGIHGTMLNKRSTKTYCINSGKGVFDIDGKNYSVGAGDIINVEPGKWLSIKGQKLKALIITNPPFNSDDEKWK